MKPSKMYELHKQGYTHQEIGRLCEKNTSQVAGCIYRYMQKNGLQPSAIRKAETGRQNWLLRKSNDLDFKKKRGREKGRGRANIPPGTLDDFLTSVDEKKCQYIEGDHESVCGKERKKGSVYCQKHYDLCVSAKVLVE